MPWLSIIMAILSYLLSMKDDPEKKSRAVAAAALAGLGTYYVSHETEWGRETLGDLDGVPTVNEVATAATAVTGADGQPVTVKDKTGATVPVKVPTVSPTTNPSSTTSGWDVLQSWGAAGTAAVVGTAAVATSSGASKWLPWLAGGAILLLLLK